LLFVALAAQRVNTGDELLLSMVVTVASRQLGGVSRPSWRRIRAGDAVRAKVDMELPAPTVRPLTSWESMLGWMRPITKRNAKGGETVARQGKSVCFTQSRLRWVSSHAA
jgi:hypothetical protein